jgi:hypothetical protein
LWATNAAGKEKKEDSRRKNKNQVSISEFVSVSPQRAALGLKFRTRFANLLALDLLKTVQLP